MTTDDTKDNSWKESFSTLITTTIATICAFILFFIYGSIFAEESSLLSTISFSFLTLHILDQISLLSLFFTLIYIFSLILPMKFLIGRLHIPPPKKIKPWFPPLADGKTDRDKFILLYPHLRSILIQHLHTTTNSTPPSTLGYVHAMINYNVQTKNYHCGLTTIKVHKTLTRCYRNRDYLTEYETARISVLGWAVEFLQASFFVADDFANASELRNQQLCWYRQSKVRNVAVNDSFLLESFVFTLLRLHFEMESYYQPLLHLFCDVIQLLKLGAVLRHVSKDWNHFTWERYQLMVQCSQTTAFCYYLPVVLGMLKIGILQNEAFDFAKMICGKIGEYVQIRRDYLNCFGDSAGTDIQDSKCTWLVIHALQRASFSQQEILENNYGQSNHDNISKVKTMYEELDLPKVFETYEKESYETIQNELENVTVMPRDVFDVLLGDVYQKTEERSNDVF